MFKFKPFGYFRHRRYWLSRVAWSGYHVMVCMRGRLIGPDSGSPPWHRIATGPWCLLKVRLCSPLQLVTLLYRCVFRLLPTPSSSTSQNPSCTNLFGKLLCTYFYDIFSDTDYVQNRSRKYICLKISSTIAWRRRLGFGDFVRWTRRQYTVRFLSQLANVAKYIFF